MNFWAIEKSWFDSRQVQDISLLETIHIGSKGHATSNLLLLYGGKAAVA
jgi:hypothetical protein